MEDQLVTIVRNGNLINVEEDRLCKRDVVVLQAGDTVPADLQLVDSRALEIDEFELTGEIMPVIKEAGSEDSMVYMGTRVLKGTGKGIVVASGEQTEYGKILAQERAKEEPYKVHFFKKQYLVLIGLLLPAFVMHLERSNHHGLVVAVYFALVIMLILLQNGELFKHLLISKENNKLRRSNIQLRDRSILSWVNQIDVFCFDKTGVLTKRNMEVTSLYFADGTIHVDRIPGAIEERTFEITKKACALCHDVYYFEKFRTANPVDKALISFALKNGVDVHELLMNSKRIYDRPFDSENRYMATGFEIDGEEFYFAKGDPDVILMRCKSYMTSTGSKKKVDSDYWRINNHNSQAIGKKGNSVIAIAYTTKATDHIPKEFTFLCLLQLENSMQPGVRETIDYLKEEGIRSLLLTGDRAETATRIGKESGITDNTRIFLNGRTIDRMELSEVARQSDYCSVFARLIPSQKGVLIRLLQQRGHRVAMVGDGPNDGIALKAADIGISFEKNSSPIARRLSQVLIHDLEDVVGLIKSAKRLESREHQIKFIRILLLTVVFASIYGWAFS